jgi:hypothetical protein
MMGSIRHRGKAVEGYRSARRFAHAGTEDNSARSWTAPALWRFGRGGGMETREIIANDLKRPTTLSNP